MGKKSSSRTASSILDLAWHQEAQLLLEIGEPPLVMFVGEPGTGKTTYARQAAINSTGHPPITLSGSPEVEEAHLFGRWTLSGSETRFVDGPLPSALKNGRWLVIEEFSQIPIETRSCLMPLRDQKEITNPLTGEVLPISSGFRLVATSNSESLSCRKNTGIARVLYDGFLILEVPELDDIQVGRFLKHQFPKLPKERLARILELWNDYRSFKQGGASGKDSLSYRAASHLAALLEKGVEENKAVQIALVNKFLPADPDLFSAAKTKIAMQTATSTESEETESSESREED